MKKLFFTIAFVFLNNNAHYFEAQKYKEAVDQTVDKYVTFCDFIENKHFCKIDIVWVRLLHFQDPCVINCYHDIIRQQSVKPISHLWAAYKSGTVECDKDRFIYELCHLIFIVFEQFSIQLISTFSGESPQSLQALFEQVDVSIPIDELIDVLEKCYEQLQDIISQFDVQTHDKKLSKKWVMVIVTVAFIVKKLYERYYKKVPLEAPIPGV
jgi:hypothetical protein